MDWSRWFRTAPARVPTPVEACRHDLAELKEALTALSTACQAQHKARFAAFMGDGDYRSSCPSPFTSPTPPAEVPTFQTRLGVTRST